MPRISIALMVGVAILAGCADDPAPISQKRIFTPIAVGQDPSSPSTPATPNRFFVLGQEPAQAAAFEFSGKTIYEYEPTTDTRVQSYFRPSGDLYMVNNKGWGGVILYRSVANGYCIEQSCYFFKEKTTGEQTRAYITFPDGRSTQVVGWKEGDPDNVAAAASAISRRDTLRAGIPLIPWLAAGAKLALESPGLAPGPCSAANPQRSPVCDLRERSYPVFN